MKRKLLLVISLLATAQVHAADVGVSVSLGQPGFYGQIDIGDFAPQPRVIYPQPVIIQPLPSQPPPPIYLHVPPGQAKNWARYCNRYQACDRPVFFVRDTWYKNEYVPRYQAYRAGPGHDFRHDDRHDYKGPRGNGPQRDRGPGPQPRPGNAQGHERH